MDVFISVAQSCQEDKTGGWAAVLRCGSHVKEVYGTELNTTANRMALEAVVNAIEILTEKCNITVATNSHYVCRVLAGMDDWKKNGWHIKSSYTPKNIDLVKKLYAVKRKAKHKIMFQYVGDGVPDVERASSLAQSNARAAIVLQALE